jgi:hypothetical protein
MRKRGATTYVITKLAEISTPAMLKIQILCWDRLTSHGAAESSDATAVPIPSKTRTDGMAQQMSVLKELKSEK